jgi:N-acetylneuraminic acid mutarotase
MVAGFDNCGMSRMVDCGSCPGTQTCGGGGTANMCGCPETNAQFCARLAANCGHVSAMDSCGLPRVVLCGSCTLAQVCGAGGTANVCGTCGQDCWRTLASMPSPALTGEAMATSGGKVFVFEGAPSDGGATNATLSYDPGINEWATVAPSPQSRAFAKAAAVNNKIYVIGGCTGGDCDAGSTGANVEYDPASNTWTGRAAMPTARSGFAMAASATKIYVAGGFAQPCAPCAPVTTVEIYDPAANTWATGAAMSAARGSSAGAVIGNSFDVAGGVDSSGAPALLNEVYDSVGNAWSTPTAMGSPHVGGGASGLNGQVLATGGSDSTRNELYDPVGNLWRAVAPAPAARSSAVTATVGGIVFLVGAEAGNVPSSRFDAYWSAPPPAPAAQTILSGLGRGLSISGGYLFVAGLTNSAASPQAVIGRYTLPVDAGAMPDWSQRWPSVASQEAFNGVAATNEGVYGCGYSYSMTTDTGGSKEYKGVTAKFPIDGGAAVWVTQTPGPPGAFAYSGYEMLLGCTIVSEAQPYLYAGGYSQNSFQNNGRAYYSKVNPADGGIVFTFTDTVVNPVSVDSAFAPANGFIYVAGRKDDTGTMTPMLYEVDTFGDPPVWTHAAAYAGQFLAVTTRGSGVYAAGHRYQAGMSGPSDGLLEKLDSAGTLVWSKTYNRGAADTALRAVVVIGANVYGVGYSGVAGNTSAVIFQVDEATGDLLTTTLHGTGGEIAYAAATDGTDLYVLADINPGGPMTLLRYTVP